MSAPDGALISSVDPGSLKKIKKDSRLQALKLAHL